MFAKTLGTALFVLCIFVSSGVAGLNVSLMNCWRGCFIGIVSAVLVLILDDIIVVDGFALVICNCTAEILIADRKIVDGVIWVVGLH